MSKPSDYIPNHIAIIMDGNRRWAQARSMPPWRGHAKGQEVLRTIAKAAFSLGIKYLTVYAFSTENWNRSRTEVSYLMRHVRMAVNKYISEFAENGIRIVFLGNQENLSKSVLDAIKGAEAMTAHNTKATLGVCFNYGGMQEICDMTKQIVMSQMPLQEITPNRLAGYLYQPHIPPIDLLIRTGGEQRLSNFMLWRAAYAELYFTDTLWPDFDISDLQKALSEYGSRQRRFGS